MTGKITLPTKIIPSMPAAIAYRVISNFLNFNLSPLTIKKLGAIYPNSCIQRIYVFVTALAPGRVATIFATTSRTEIICEHTIKGLGAPSPTYPRLSSLSALRWPPATALSSLDLWIRLNAYRLRGGLENPV